MSSYRSKTVEPPFAGPRWWAAAIFLAVALLAQVELFHYFRFRNAEISGVLLVVAWYAIHVDVRRAALFGLIAGICEDALSAQTGAAWTISTTATAVVAAMLSRGFFADSIPLVAAIVVFATLLRDAIFWSAMALQGGYPAGLGGWHLHQTLWQAALNALFVALIMLALRWKAALVSR